MDRAAVIAQIHEEFREMAAAKPLAELRCTTAEERQRYFKQLCAMDKEAFQELCEPIRLAAVFQLYTTA